MLQALIIYQSKKGKTKQYAEAIAVFLQSSSFKAKAISVFDFNPEDLKGVTHLFLGCWTRGRFLMGQRPQKEWIQLVERINSSQFQRITLFTTYNIAVGVMFKNMAKYITPKPLYNMIYLKSRKGKLSNTSKTNLILYCTLNIS